ncbi:MAG: winged helix-turn-helix transcriptional regulator [Chloroflexi bacterium]|nr:winged helix-turn-helix transcriptional regulator [Chloroflexota bacterium]
MPVGNGGAPVGFPALAPARARALARVFKALADPTRVQIVSLLLSVGDSGLCVCHIVANFRLGQPTISHHLKVLKDAGLLTAWKSGLWVHYAVRRDRLAGLGIALPALTEPLLPAASCGPTGAFDGRDGCGRLTPGGPDV